MCLLLARWMPWRCVESKDGMGGIISDSVWQSNIAGEETTNVEVLDFSLLEVLVLGNKRVTFLRLLAANFIKNNDS